MRIPTHLAPSFVAALSLLAAAAGAEVGQLAPNGFLVRHEATVAAPPEKVWSALVDQVGAWWHPDHTWSGEPANLSIVARPGGCFCEKLPDGGGVEHLRVVYVVPGEKLRMEGALGPLQASGLAGSLTFEMGPTDGGTTLILTYSVGGFVEMGTGALAPIVDRVLGEQLSRLAAYAETGSPALPVPAPKP
ncbi:MAG TPA: SRPBCC domain-containing protein [Thermoanaerobaculia bacterium]|nr:SRPBCC domain-containing protein [Thermoanaerobaculia bacterium]